MVGGGGRFTGPRDHFDESVDADRLIVNAVPATSVTGESVRHGSRFALDSLGVPVLHPRTSPMRVGRLAIAGILLGLSAVLVPSSRSDSKEAAEVMPAAAGVQRGGLRAVGPAHLIAKALFFVYQRGAAPSKGQKCPMSPSCSEYGRLAVERFGLVKGSLMAADRLHRCGHDLRYYPTVFDDRGAGSWDPPAQSGDQ